MKKSCLNLPRMLYLSVVLLFGILSSVRFVWSELLINEVSLGNESSPQFDYVELINNGSAVEETDYLLVFYNGKSNLSLSISKLNNVSLDNGELYVVLSAKTNLYTSIPIPIQYDNSTDLPILGDTVAAIALFKFNSPFNSGEITKGSQVGFVIENATFVNALVFTTGWTQNLSASHLASEFGFEKEQIIIGDFTKSLSFCGNITERLSEHLFKNTTQTAGLENNCETSPPVISTPDSTVTTSPTTVTTATPSTPNITLSIPTLVTHLTVTVPSTSEKPTTSRKVVINEVYVNPPTPGDFGEYVELLDLSGKENVSLDGLTLVFWNGKDLTNYSMMHLTGNVTGPNGYFVISNANDNNTHLHHDKNHFIQNGPMDGIVLYEKLNESAVKDGEIPTDNILDAVVYSKIVTHNPSDILLKTLFPDQMIPIYLHTFSNYTVLARCYSKDKKTLAAFASVNVTTKAARNVCLPPKGLHINELKLSSNKFIELTSGERASFPLEQMVLTTFNAVTNTTTGSVRLSGKTNPNLALLAEKPLNSTPPIDDDRVVSILDSLTDTFAGAVALYWRPDDSDTNITVTTEGLLDIVIYGNDTMNASSEFLTAFNKTQVNLPNDLGNNSVNYCPRDKQIYIITVSSPNSTNKCPIPHTTSTTVTTPSLSPSSSTPPSTTAGPVLFQINEVYLGNSQNFVEIKGQSNEPLDNLLVAFLEYGNSIVMKSSVNLASKRLSTGTPYGLHVVEGPTVTVPKSASNDSAVVLYRLQSPSYAVTTFDKLIQDAHLLDFIVYNTQKTMMTSELVKKLAGSQTDQVAIWVDVDSTDMSITRCREPLRETWSFWLMQQSKNRSNPCPMPEIVINEINADNPSFDDQEFLELFDFGIGRVSLNPFVLVSFNGNNGGKKAAVVNLWNQRTDENGLFLLAVEGQNLSTDAQKRIPPNPPFFQNGPDAIALYQASPSKFDSSSQPTTDGLIDVVIYGKTSHDHSLINSLISALTPGGSSVVTSQDKIDLSMSRCLCWGTSKSSNAKAFVLSHPTPSEFNKCPTSFTTQLPALAEIFINELNSDSQNRSVAEFLELKGPNMTKLDNRSLVFYNLSSGQINQAIKLDGYSMDKDGFFIIGVVPNAEIAVQQQVFLENGLGGVALYDRRQWECVPESKMSISRPGLLDAIVYTSTPDDINKTATKDYLKALTLDNHVVEDSKAFTQDETINRCFDDRKLTWSRFVVSLPTPRAENTCPSDTYQLQISFKLINADCQEFTKSESLKLEVATYVVTKVNSICRCGLTMGNLASYKFVCGSVILDATVYTFSHEQKELIEKSHKSFIKSSDTVVFNGKTFSVDKTCISDCRAVRPLTKKPETDHTVTIAVVVTCVVILAIIFVLVFVYYKRKRKGIAHFRMARFDAEDENLTVGDMDDFVGEGRGEQASFNNPLYFK